MAQESDTPEAIKKNRTLVKAFNMGGKQWTNFIGGEGAPQRLANQFWERAKPTTEQIRAFVLRNAHSLDLSKMEENLVDCGISNMEDLRGEIAELQVKNDSFLIQAFNLGNANAFNRVIKGKKLTPQELASFVERNLDYLDLSKLEFNLSHVEGMEEAFKDLTIAEEKKMVILANFKPSSLPEMIQDPEELAKFLHDHKNQLSVSVSTNHTVTAKLTEILDMDSETRVVILFNMKPHKYYNKLGETHEEIAKFLYEKRGILDPVQVGEFLGDRKDHSKEILKAYGDLVKEEFEGMDFVPALRTYLSKFKIPGEAQRVDRILEDFGRIYAEVNPVMFPDDDIVKKQESAYSLAMGILGVNTTVQKSKTNPKIKAQTMKVFESTYDTLATEIKFQKIDRKNLEAIYSEVRHNPFEVGAISAEPVKFSMQSVEDACNLSNITPESNPKPKEFSVNEVIEERSLGYEERVERQAKESLEKELVKAFNKGKEAWKLATKSLEEKVILDFIAKRADELDRKKVEENMPEIAEGSLLDRDYAMLKIVQAQDVDVKNKTLAELANTKVKNQVGQIKSKPKGLMKSAIKAFRKAGKGLVRPT